MVLLIIRPNYMVLQGLVNYIIYNTDDLASILKIFHVRNLASAVWQTGILKTYICIGTCIVLGDYILLDMQDQCRKGRELMATAQTNLWNEQQMWNTESQIAMNIIYVCPVMNHAPCNYMYI